MTLQDALALPAGERKAEAPAAVTPPAEEKKAGRVWIMTQQEAPTTPPVEEKKIDAPAAAVPVS